MGPPEHLNTPQHDHMFKVIDVHIGKNRKHWTELGSAPAILLPNFGSVDMEILTQTQALLSDEDFTSAMICVTMYLSHLLCGLSHTHKPIDTCGPLQCRILKLVHAWDNEQPLIIEIRDKSSELHQTISKIKEDSDFTPTVERLIILFAQFGELSQMFVYPQQYIPPGTDLKKFDKGTFPIHHTALTQMQFQIAAYFKEAAFTAEFNTAGNNYFNSEKVTVLKFIICTLANRCLELDSELITQDINGLLLFVNFHLLLGALAQADPYLKNLQAHKRIDQMIRTLIKHLRWLSTKYCKRLFYRHYKELTSNKGDNGSVMNIGTICKSLTGNGWSRQMYAFTLCILGHSDIATTYEKVESTEAEINKLHPASLLSHFLLDHKPNLLTIDPSLIRIQDTYTFVPGAWEPNGIPPVPSVPKSTPQVQQSTPTTQGLSQANIQAPNFSPVGQTPASSLTTNSVTAMSSEQIQNLYNMIVNAQTATSTILNSQKDNQQSNIVLSPAQFQELNRNLNETLKTEIQTEIRALDTKRSTTDMATLVKAFKENKDTQHLLTEAVAEAIKGTLKPTIEALVKAAIERNISEVADKLQETFTTNVKKFLNDQRSSGLTAQVNKNTKSIDKLSKCFTFAANQTEVFVKAVNEALSKNLKGIFKSHPTVLKLIEQQPLMNDKTVKLIDEFLTDFGFNYGPLPSPDASKEEQEAFDLALTSESSNTAQAATDQDSTKSDNGSEESKHNESTPKKSDDNNDDDTQPTPRGMDPNDLNPHP